MVKLSRILNFRNIVIIIICLLLIILMAYSDIYLQSVRNGLNLYVVSVLPSMLPFFFFSKMLTELGFATDAGQFLKKPLKKIYGSPSIGGYILIMSMLCGYPVGAKLIGECHKKCLINKEEARTISTFSSTSGPLFIIGTVGVGMFENKLYGFILLISHYIGTLLNGIIYRRKSSSAVNIPSFARSEDMLNSVMLNTFLSVGIVGGYITIFNLFLDVLQNIGIIPGIAKIFAFLGVPGRITSGVAGGLIEMTKGCLMLSSTGFPILIILPLCEFVITFGGLSVTLQSMTFLSETKISPAFYLLSKFTQGILCTLICFIITLIVI